MAFFIHTVLVIRLWVKENRLDNNKSFLLIAFMKIEFFHNDIEKFIRSLEDETVAKVLRVFDLLEKFGHALKMPHSKHVKEGIFELRIRGSQEVRFFYFFHKTKIIFVLYGFMKKSQKIPDNHLKTALSRKKEIDRI